MNRHNVTVVSTGQPCGKTAALQSDGTVAFTAAGNVIKGTAWVIEVPTAQDLLRVLQSLKPDEYVIPDFPPAALNEPGFDIVTKAKHSNPYEAEVPYRDAAGNLVVCLTDKPGVWEFGAWRVLDRDVDENTPGRFKVLYDEWLDLVDKHLLPGVKKAPRVLWPSSKSRVAGGAVPNTLNCHTWVDCTGVERTNEMRDRIRLQSVVQGVAWHAPRHSRATGERLPGKGLGKTLFDLSVFSIHRIIYAGPPSVGDGLAVLPAAGDANEGIPLDLATSLPALSSARVAEFSAATGLDAKIRHSHAGDSLISTDRTQMTLASHVILEDGSEITVKDFLRNPTYQFDFKFRCQAMFRESSSWNGIIRKYANGQVMHHDNGTGITYWLPAIDWEHVCDQYVQSQGAGDAQALNRLAQALAMLSKGDYEAHRDAIHRRTGLQKQVLNSIRETAVSARRKLATDRELESLTVPLAGPPRDIATIKDGADLAREYFSNWVLYLSSQKTEAVTFTLDPSSYGQGTSLRFSSYALPALVTFTRAFPLEIVDPQTGEIERKSPVDVWVESSARCGVSSLTFEPGLAKHVGNALNLWTGWPLAPLSGTSKCERFLQHVHEVIADGNQDVANYVLNWLALRVQGIAKRKPGSRLLRMNVAIVLRSVQGTGKSMFEKYIATMFGPHALITTRGSSLAGRFNSEFAHLVMLLAEEAFFAGNHEQQNSLKGFLTEPCFTFEQKFKDAVSLPNHCAVIMSTNKDWAVPADGGERRMCVLDVSACRKGDQEYFSDLAQEMEGDGPAALFAYLLERDIAGFNVNDFPRTQALMDQQVRTIGRDSPTADYILEAMETGEIRFMDDVGLYSSERVIKWGHEWTPVPRKNVGEAVRSLARNTGKFGPPANEIIGKDLRKLIGLGNRQKVAPGEVCRSVDPMNESGGPQVNCWELPPLELAKERFRAYLQRGSWD